MSPSRSAFQYRVAARSAPARWSSGPSRPPSPGHSSTAPRCSPQRDDPLGAAAPGRRPARRTRPPAAWSAPGTRASMSRPSPRRRRSPRHCAGDRRVAKQPDLDRHARVIRSNASLAGTSLCGTASCSCESTCDRSSAGRKPRAHPASPCPSRASRSMTPLSDDEPGSSGGHPTRAVRRKPPRVRIVRRRESAGQSSSRARPVAGGCARARRRDQRCADPGAEHRHLRDRPAHLQLGRLGAAERSRCRWSIGHEFVGEVVEVGVQCPRFPRRATLSAARATWSAAAAATAWPAAGICARTPRASASTGRARLRSTSRCR